MASVSADPGFEDIRRVYLNGVFVAPEQALVSVFDRGMIFGDGVYEIVPAFGAVPLRLDHHLERLSRSLAAVRIPQPLTREQWRDVLWQLAEDPRHSDQTLYLQVTRGVALRDHGFPRQAEPTVFAYSQLLAPPPPGELERGIAVVTAADIRWHRCDIKSTSLLANVLLRQQAREQGAEEAVLVRDGHVTEGSASNVFVVLDGVIVTPPKGPELLPGITRDLVVDLLSRNGLDHREAPVPEDALRRAEEIWITSSSREIRPVTRLDGRPVGDGVPGARFQRVRGLYEEYKAQARRAGET